MDRYLMFEKPRESVEFDWIRIGIASPEKIESLSHGEVKKPETINYRTFKPERDGLFCARIFGPVKDYECLCGKYKRLKHRGIVCEKCGVEVISSSVRRERMGHIELACPVAHIWYVKSLPSRIALLLDIKLKDLERVLYFEHYIIVESKVKELPVGTVIDVPSHRRLTERFPTQFRAQMGAEAVQFLLKSLDMKQLGEALRREMVDLGSKTRRKKVAKRLQVVEAFVSSGNDPSWMTLNIIPVIPPELRPLVPLDSGRFATSDLNDLYRRVINRNNRLKRLLDLNAPEIIINNEKRMLQEAVDALFDNGRTGRAISGTNKRPLKSLSDMLKGKQGRFRKNLLGKRVDYSGRSVIVVGPHLKLHQCGLPKRMAYELFKPFLYNRLIKYGFAPTIRSAKKMVEAEEPVVWDMLEEIIKEHPVMLNRAPTLHRLGIQAFEPILIEGKAIQLHPLVCTAFNADFDGDQMAVHVPLSIESQTEARVLMLATNNILSPANGRPIINPTQDIVLGLYYLTKQSDRKADYTPVFSSPREARIAHDQGHLSLHAPVKVRMEDMGKIQLIETTMGRLMLREIVPSSIPMKKINRVMTKGNLAELIDICYRGSGEKETVLLADRLKDLGFAYATRSGISIGVRDMVIPQAKVDILGTAEKAVAEIVGQYREGIISDGERYNKIVDVWTHAAERLTSAMMENLSTMRANGLDALPSFNSIYVMADSGARGSSQQIRQLAGMRGLMAKPSGEIIETPITSNFREGLTVLQYFISTHGARKGLADTALKTANAGYLTRRLVDVAQDAIIMENDCGTTDGIPVRALVESGEVIESLSSRILGRTVLEDILDPFTGEVLLKAGAEITESDSERIEESGIDEVMIRTALTCEALRGVCALCYGRDLARGRRVTVGEAAGIIAAQSIGEPGTQLTMRTFHVGGTASRMVDQSSVEARTSGFLKLHNTKVVRSSDGKWTVMNRNGFIAVQDESGREREKYPVIYGAKIQIAENAPVKPGQSLVEWDPFANPILTDVGGTVHFVDIVEGQTYEEQTDPVTGISSRVIIETKDAKKRPKISIRDANGHTIPIPGSNSLANYFLPVGAILSSQDGQEVGPGDPIARMMRETAKTKDITGGLPRVAELFEARVPKDFAIISEIAGTVTFGKDTKGKRKIIVTPEHGEPREYLVPKRKHIAVHEGDYVRPGEALMDGPANPHDILRVLGEKELARYLVNEIQEVYRLQGVKINDKHIEIIVRQMLRKIRVVDPGDSSLLAEDIIDKHAFRRINDDLFSRGAKPLVAEPQLLGITKASLSTDSFIAAASFQETTKVLTQASIEGRIDPLLGLKENVIMGRLIPAGTGHPAYKDLQLIYPEGEIEMPKPEPAPAPVRDMDEEEESVAG